MINMPGGPEVLVIFVVALVVLGPQQLPKAMRTLGSVMAEIRKVSNGFQAEMRNAMDGIVETSATEKATTTPARSATSASTGGVAGSEDSAIDEIVVRNEPDAAAAAADGTADDEVARPGRAGDPVDRAAG